MSTQWDTHVLATNVDGWVLIAPRLWDSSFDRTARFLRLFIGEQHSYYALLQEHKSIGDPLMFCSNVDLMFHSYGLYQSGIEVQIIPCGRFSELICDGHRRAMEDDAVLRSFEREWDYQHEIPV